MNNSKFDLSLINVKACLATEFFFYFRFLQFFFPMFLTNKLMHTRFVYAQAVYNAQFFNKFQMFGYAKYENLTMNFLFKNVKNQCLSKISNLSHKNIKNTFKYKIYFFNKIFSLLFLFNFYLLDSSSKFHHNYKLIFARSVKSFL